MNYIKCPKCGKEEPAFDYAHVCGPVQVKKSFNTRLREFERESGLEIFGLGARRETWERALEKYAELVVRECANVATINQFQWDSSGKYILKHFDIDQ